MGEKFKSCVKSIGTYGIKLLFLLCILFVTIEVYFYRISVTENSVWMILGILAVLVFLLCTAFFAKRFESHLERCFPVIFTGYLLILFIVQIICGNCMRYTPMWDLGSVYDGAITWTEQGNLEGYEDYFYFFPNNLGLMVVFRCFFGVVRAMFGAETDYFMAALVLGSVVVTVFRFSVVWICRKLFGTGYACVTMVLLLLCLPLYFAAGAFYTDVMSMAAPALSYLCYLYAKEADSLKKRIGWYCLLALVAAVGMEIKFTVVITLIAIGICLLLQEGWRRFLLFAGVQFVLIGAVFGAVDHVIYSGLLEREKAELMNTPYLHWVMMGARGNGGYNPEDYEFTRSFQDTGKRRKALLSVIKTRYRELGVQGTFDMWKAKTVRCFGDGSLAMSDFFDDEPAQNTSLHSWILYSGENFAKYQALCLNVFLAIMLLMLFGVVGSLGKHRVYSFDLLVPWLAFFGVWLFLMFWETSARYFTNHLSMMLIAAVYGLSHLLCKLPIDGNWKVRYDDINIR